VSRRLLLLALALCGLSHASAEPRLDLTVAPAWKGWTRPGRTTEIDIRLSSDVASLASLDVVAGRQSVGASVELQPGRVARLQIAVDSVPAVAVGASAPSATAARREVTLAQSESPLLGVALASDERVELDGFHAIALTADDLPRNASAYSSIDALILDAATLGALDQSQLGALVTYAADCGRIAVLNPELRVRRLLDGAGGCDGRAVMSATSLPEATALLSASLAKSIRPPLSPGSVGALARPVHAAWNAVAVILAVYFAAAALAIVFAPSLPAMLLLPALAIVATVALMQGLNSRSQLVVWSEGATGAQLARYQAWQRFPGIVRERVRVPLPPQLGTAVHICEPDQAVRFEVDPSGGRAMFAEFDTRLFGQVALCYSGTFPMQRAIAIDARADGSRAVRNAGARAWPRGALLVGGVVHELPALGPGATAVIGAQDDRAERAAALRTALTRVQAEGTAALWSLDLAGVAGAPVDSTGWLLVSVPPAR
jgi:hypothetical protein